MHTKKSPHTHRAHNCLSVTSFLEGDEDEDTNTISQADIADAVDITSGSKVIGQRFVLNNPVYY